MADSYSAIYEASGPILFVLALIGLFALTVSVVAEDAGEDGPQPVTCTHGRAR